MSADAAIDISICIANYNGDEILCSCLASIEAQKTSAAVEIIVHDDASADDSIAAARARFPDVEVIESPTNVGFCAANNKMASRARGRFLLLLNNDTELQPGALGALFNAASRDPDGVYSLTEYTTRGEVSCRGMGLDVFFTPYACKRSGDHVIYAMGACLLVAKSIWNQLGGFPEPFQYTAEDLYLCLAARANGYPTRIVDGPGYVHHISQSTNVDGVSPARRALSERNRYAVLRGLVLRREQLLIVPLYWLMHVVESTYWRLKGIRMPDVPKLAFPVTPKRVSILRRLKLFSAKLAYFHMTK